MAFWLDRFRREDEEDIWEELKQMLKNSDKYEAEKKLQEARELEAFNKAWDKANGVNTKSASPKNSKEKLIGMATPVLEGKVVYEKEPSIYEEIDARKDWSDELKAQKKAEVAKIQQAYEARDKEIDREYTLGQLKDYAGAALEIGSAFVPGALGSKVATGAIKTTKPLIEQIVKKNITRGGVEGLASGAMSGLGQGMLEDENLLKSSVIGGLTGGTVGSALGKISGEVVANTHNIKKLDELLDKRNDWGIAFTKQSGKPVEAIEKLLEQKQGFVPKATNKEGIGDIDFVWGKGGKRGYGFAHIVDQRNKDGLDGIEFSKKVPDIIAKGNAEKIANQPNIDFIRSYDDSALIKKVWDDKKRNWIVTAFKDKESLNKSINRTPDIVNNQNGMAPPLNLNKDNNIIMSSYNNLNPSQQSIQKPLSHNEWLEELKRRRKKGWW